MVSRVAKISIANKGKKENVINFRHLQETSADGTFIIIQNTHRAKEELIGEWKLKRKIDGKKEIIYTFPQNFILKPGKSVKVFHVLKFQYFFRYLIQFFNCKEKLSKLKRYSRLAKSLNLQHIQEKQKQQFQFI